MFRMDRISRPRLLSEQSFSPDAAVIVRLVGDQPELEPLYASPFSRRRAETPPPRCLPLAPTGAEHCEVHGLPLKRSTAPILYGLRADSPGLYEAEDRLFPHRHSYGLGGCLVYEGMPERAEVLFCPACRRAEKEWNAARRRRRR